MTGVHGMAVTPGVCTAVPIVPTYASPYAFAGRAPPNIAATPLPTFYRPYAGISGAARAMHAVHAVPVAATMGSSSTSIPGETCLMPQILLPEPTWRFISAHRVLSFLSSA